MKWLVPKTELCGARESRKFKWRMWGEYLTPEATHLPMGQPITAWANPCLVGNRFAPEADCYLSSEASLISEAASEVGAPASEISRGLGHLGTSEAPGPYGARAHEGPGP